MQYRVRITPEQPDFRLIVMPTSTKTPMGEMVQAGSAQALTVLVWRQDGFEGPITLSMEGLPPGVQCPPQYVGPGQRQTALSFVASADARPWTGAVTIKGTAEIDGKKVVREARPATISWAVPNNQNVPALSRLDHSLVLAVRPDSPFHLKPVADTIKVHAGESPTIKFKVERLQPDFKGTISLTLLNMPQTQMLFNNNQPLNVTADKKEASGTLIVRTGLAPGNYTVVLRVQAQVSVSKDATAKAKSNVNLTAAAFPVTITVEPKSGVSGTLTLTPGEVTVQKGKSADIEVKVKRPPELTGDLKVEVVTAGAQGVTGEGTIIPANKTRGKITVKVDANTRSGPRNLIVRLSNKKGNAEAPLTVTVVRPPN